MTTVDHTIRVRQWTRPEYDRLIETGFFHEDDNVELIGGQLMVAEPQGSRHAATISLVADALRGAFGSGWYVMVQLPIALDEESEPEPDVAVVRGTAREHAETHPARPVLVVEVAQSSVALDRHHKANLYARAGVPEYWIVDIVDDVLEVYRRPVPSADAVFGSSYADVQRFPRGATVFPLAASTTPVVVTDLMI
jgi:Uma2 family endonuclease